MLNWANRFNIFCLLDNNNYQFSSPQFECLLAAGCIYSVTAEAGDAFKAAKQFSQAHPGAWLFGHLGYDLKNESGRHQSKNFDGIGFPDLHFFEPEHVIRCSGNEVTITTSSEPGSVFSMINDTAVEETAGKITGVHIQQRVPESDYLEIVEKLRAHILRGDCYEINFCQEFYTSGCSIDPLTVYRALKGISPNPFAAFYKFHDRFCICASPERYLRKEGNKLISQPIKGTARRDLLNESFDRENRNGLLQSEKERSENVMVVDLVRNDLSRVCRPGTVRVEELFGIYSFPQVHQMISTVAGEVDEGIHWVDIVEATFPMGSMTGAPKERVMDLIESVEKTKRGLFSGAIGYINPSGDFDFNVVIRSILYNATNHYIS